MCPPVQSPPSSFLRTFDTVWFSMGLVARTVVDLSSSATIAAATASRLGAPPVRALLGSDARPH